MPLMLMHPIIFYMSYLRKEKWLMYDILAIIMWRGSAGLSGLTCRTGAAVERAQGVEALHRGVCGAGFVREAALIDISRARRPAGWRHPASITDTLIFGLKRDMINVVSKLYDFMLRRTEKETLSRMFKLLFPQQY